MLNEPTLDKLKTMRMHAMATAWLEQQGDPEIAALSFDERFGLLVDIEWVDRDNKRMKRNLRAARLRLSQACIEDIDYAPERKLDKAVVRQLATCRWVHEHRAVVITGATGTGKTYLACALTLQAIRRGKKALYRRASRLFDELLLSHADGTYAKVLARIAKIDVLVIDDFGMAPLKDLERHDLLEILEDRHGNGATIIATQLPVKQWHEVIGDATVADAICDRVVHGAYRLDLKGPSRRDPKTTRSNEASKGREP